MFRDDVAPEDRRKALALRMDAARPPEENLSGGHRRLVEALDAAPGWLLARVSREMFEDDLLSVDRTDEQQALAAFAAEAGLEAMPFALSRVGLAAALKGRMGRCVDAGRIADILEGRLAAERARQEAMDPAARKRRQAALREFHSRSFDLVSAMEMRRRQERRTGSDEGPGLPPSFGPDASIEVGDGLSARRMSVKEARLLADSWGDGWLAMSPEHAARGSIPGKQYRRDLADRVNGAGGMLGVFDASGTLVGSVRANPVSENAVEIGWFVVPEARGKGIATHVAAAAVVWLADRGYRTFGARTMASNAASVRVMEKLGFAPVEGHVAVGSDIDWVSMTAAADAAVPAARSWLEGDHRRAIGAGEASRPR